MSFSEVVCPAYAPFFGMAGGTLSMVFSAIGAAYGTAKAGTGIVGISTFKPEAVMKSLIPVVMAGIVAIYGLVVAVLISSGIGTPGGAYSLASGLVHLGAGLSTGLAGMAAGIAVGFIGDAAVRGYLHQPKLFVGMVLMLIFAEVIGLYGLIVGLILQTRADNSICFQN
ncbi:hypothetical protein H696_00106 [Fonticula alba]|uniref:V-type proton ATPase proteolipid subunit n=1 Tax=Fonticula alba TaxID=691883 RepID=A0A058ZGB2_FONAL|nr:hypothetical protein H696_00106 [Fonticula alba]KCV72512.1 hypothetical protein H696_00106 [Fonticula alba]|eukprot:XP_009492213.1 hypothetical protein H696_00106 [Fonticula alba]